ncbi:MAG: hypothetical protein EPO21_20445 [Chloroflexota bacterium]|nr:MAG: hypothetical protein EPO21_20445 [Chloroflexota bacterium]
MGTYVYAITYGGSQNEIGRLGLPDGQARVVALRQNGLAAVVSNYQGPAFTALSKPALLRYLAIHQQVVEHAMDHRRVLPVKFGTVLASLDEARIVLDRWHGRLASALDLLGDVVEVEVAATWDTGRIFSEIGRLPEIAALAARVADHSDQQTVMELGIRVGKLVKEELDRRREKFRQQVVDDLMFLARDAQANLLPSDELVVNVAFLIERARLDDFYACVHQLDRSFQNRLTFRCIGPLPPYSFGTVEITRPHATEIDAARRMLELSERVSEAEITASYRRLAARYHPDHNTDDPLATKRFVALTTAHAQLITYLRGRSGLEGEANQSQHYDLASGAVESSLLLAIKRSGSQFVPSARAS